jgi:hypothetical protein
MWVECCDPLDLRKEVCTNCPELSTCITFNTEKIKEIFEETNKEENTIIRWWDQRDLL